MASPAATLAPAPPSASARLQSRAAVAATPGARAAPRPSPIGAARRLPRGSVARRVAEKETKKAESGDGDIMSKYTLDEATTFKLDDEPTNSTADEPTLDERLSKLLPEREPGEFPQLGVHPLGWTGMVSLDEADEYDPLRDGPLRYLGYANELGEAFRAFLPAGGVPASYGVAIAYVLVDTVDKGFKAKQESVMQLYRKKEALPEGLDTDRLATVLATERSIDTVVWQLLASVAIPGFTIHQVVALTHGVLDPHLQHLSAFELQEISQAATNLHMARDLLVATIDKVVPTAMGLITIPFIVEPIDESVHTLMDNTLRPAMKSFICENMQGKEAGLDMCYVPDEE